MNTIFHYRAVIYIWLLLFFIGCLAGAGSAYAQDGGSSWVSKIVSVQGHVVVKRQGQNNWQQAQLNDRLFVGDQIRIEANSRAGIVLSNDTVLRLDQNTTLVFAEVEEETTFVLKLLEGAANFFSRRPRSIRFLTPFINGVVEGTEFYLQVDAEQTRIDLFEGRIFTENPHGTLQLEKGEGIVATADHPAQRRLLVQPRDSVKWALYYPPLPSLGLEDGPSRLQASLNMADQGSVLEALDHLSKVAEEDRDVIYYVFRAGLRLNVGRVAEAQDDLHLALKLAPGNGEAVALQAVIAVVQNRNTEALALARDAVQRDSDSPVTQIALSYALQSVFDLPGALSAAKEAVARAPESSTAWARLAELQFSTHALNPAIQAAQKATEYNPQNAHAHTVLGFISLAQNKVQKARSAFEKAIALDSAAPMPRLGLGLAEIRNGNLALGRSQIEIAAGLDPFNALIRSYLGKAYFEEKRTHLDGTQLDIAKILDPKDPTPWYYDAIRKQTLNRPVEALRDSQKSITLNDNRAIYRSRLLLDDDLAARSAGMGRIYSDLGFEQLALSEGWKAVNTHHGDYSGHRLLADSYSKLRRHDIARASELLQAKLLQPLNLTALQPQLGETDLLIPDGAGPAKASFNEFNPLFVRDGLRFHGSAVAGSNDTFGDELTISGLHRNVSFSLGQLHYETDGFRENNDLALDIYNGFVQFSPSSKSSFQAEVRSREDERGDLRMFFEPDVFNEERRTDESQTSFRVGGRLELSVRDTLLVSLIHSDLNSRRTDHSDAGDPAVQVDIDMEFDVAIETDSGELQYLHQSDRYTLISGLGLSNEDRTEHRKIVTTTTIAPMPPIPPLPPEIDRDTSTDFPDSRYTNVYTYTHLKMMETMIWTLGVTYDALKNESVAEEKFNPKIGLAWSPVGAFTFRGAWFKNLKRPFITNETLEPTQVAGFNQFFDDPDGSETERYGIAVDAKFTTDMFAGVEFSWRDIESPTLEIDLDTDTEKTVIDEQREKFHRIYFNWLATNRLSLSAEGFFEEIDISDGILEQVTTYRYPLGLRYQFPFGLFAKVLSTYVDQDLKRDGEDLNDDFWVVDAAIGYRLPKRLGTVTLGVKNLLDEEFRFQDYNFNTDEPLSPFYIPEALVFGQVTIAFN